MSKDFNFIYVPIKYITSISKLLISTFSMFLLVFPGRALFSPHVDYNEWLPVGKADPLKNDPTFDYSPPILDRVHYWGDTSKDKKDILLLGVSSKRNFYTQPNTNHVTQNEPQHSNRRNFYMSEVWLFGHLTSYHLFKK